MLARWLKCTCDYWGQGLGSRVLFCQFMKKFAPLPPQWWKFNCFNHTGTSVVSHVSEQYWNRFDFYTFPCDTHNACGARLYLRQISLYYRLDDESRCLREFRSPRKLSYRRPEREARGRLFGFQDNDGRSATSPVSAGCCLHQTCIPGLIFVFLVSHQLCETVRQVSACNSVVWC